MDRKSAISLFLGSIVSALALYLAFRHVPARELSAYLVAIDYGWMIPAVIVSLFTFVLRTLRWQTILSTTTSLRFADAYHPLMIGFMINCVLPGRAGELARPAILKKKEGIAFSTGLATVAAERAFDIIFILALLGIVLCSVDIDPSVNMTFGNYDLNRETLTAISKRMVLVMVLLVSGMLLLSIRKLRECLKRCVLRAAGLLFFLTDPSKRKVRETVLMPLSGVIENAAAGFALVRSPGKVVRCALLSLMIWGFSVLSYQIMAMGCPGITVSFTEMTAVMIIVCFFIALPSVPGFWGIWEAGGVFALSLFGISTEDAAGYTLVNHVVQVIPVILLGLVSALLTGINILQITRERG